MAEFLSQGKQKTGSLVKDEFLKGRGSNLLDSILDALLGDYADSETEDWCLWLLSGGQEPGEFLKELKSHNTSPVCGLVWNAHFVAYRCRDCAISPCMSLCADCFINGNHEGHDFNMFRSQAGGACDCGDENVMRKQGYLCPCSYYTYYVISLFILAVLYFYFDSILTSAKLNINDD